MSVEGSFPEDESSSAMPPRHELDENGPDISVSKAGEDFLATIHVEFIQHMLDFQHCDEEVNAFALHVLDGAQDKEAADSNGKTLDEYITGAAEALSQLVIEMQKPGQTESEEGLHELIMQLLKKSDDERTALFNGMVDQTKMTFGYEDEEEISGKVAEVIALSNDSKQGSYDLASRVAEIYFAMASAKLATAWGYIDASENQDEWAKLIETVEEINNKTKKETLQQQLGRHALEVVKVVVGTALGVLAGLAADAYLRRKK